MAVPKTIYSLWLQGRANAPGLAKLNFERWERLNPGYRLVVLEHADVEALLRPVGLHISHISPQALSDVVRARLLAAMGGIWVDASLFPMKPLDEWIGSQLTEENFFAFERPGPDRAISSWFLVAGSGNAMIEDWWREVCRFWSKLRVPVNGIPSDPVAAVSPETQTYPYYWFHYLFGYLVATNPGFAARWERCVKAPAQPPCRLLRLFEGNNQPSEAEIREAADAAPVQKLNWRATYYPLELLAAL